MPTLDSFVVTGKSAFIKLDDIFPECSTFSSSRTPRLVCIPEPNVCSACKSLPSLVNRMVGVFKASEWELLIIYWYVGSTLRALVSRKEDPGGVALIVVNQSVFTLLKKGADEYTIEMPLYT